MLPEPSQTRSIRSLLSRHSLQFPLSKGERHFTVIPLWKALPSSVALCSSLASFRASLLTGHVILWTYPLLFSFIIVLLNVRLSYFSAIKEELPMIA